MKGKSDVAKLLALDPGLTTGFALIKFDPRTMDLISLQVSQERKEDAKAWGSKPMDILISEKPNFLVIEDFIGAGPRTKESNYVLKMIGAYEAMGSKLGAEVSVQANSMRRPFLKGGVNFYRSLKGTNPCHHGKDALAHGLRFLHDRFAWDYKRWFCDF